jgi:hypothetical protein
VAGIRSDPGAVRLSEPDGNPRRYQPQDWSFPDEGMLLWLIGTPISIILLVYFLKYF